jgi:hypothetical protein
MTDLTSVELLFRSAQKGNLNTVKDILRVDLTLVNAVSNDDVRQMIIFKIDVVGMIVISVTRTHALSMRFYSVKHALFKLAF